ncbi:MAG: hypothetical protein WD875_05655 [Pirellulales bacterium]
MSDAAETPSTPDAASPYVFTSECRALLDVAGLTEAEAIEAFERRDDAMVVPSVPAHLYGVRWLESGEAIFTSGELTRMEWRVDRSVPAEITIRVALRLRPNLPAGSIGRGMPIDCVWARIAESFGVNVTCHKKTGSFARYTGRWDGKPPRYETAQGDTIVVDGGFERSRDSVKYVWALSTNKYRDWLATGGSDAATPEGGSQDVAGEHPPRVVFARMAPARLARQIVVRADIGEATVRLVCSRASLVDIDDPPFFHPRMKCLHVFGAELLEGDDLPKQLAGKEYVIPIHFVTDLRPGPNVFLTNENAAPRSAVLPNDYKPGNRMSLKMIEMQLGEWTEPAAKTD